LAAEFKRYPLLTREREAKLARRWLKRRDERARQAILNANLMNVWIMARRYRFCGQQFEDLVSEGSIALMKALDHYDPDLGVRFWSYASRVVANDMLYYVRKFQSLATRPKRRSAFGPADVVAVNSYDYDGEGVELRDESPSPEQIAGDEDAAEVVRLALCSLTARQRLVVNHRFLSARPMILGDISKILGVSKQRISQYEKAAISRLRLELSLFAPELAEVM
jgi:RNA polymerase sporulation-specific sigma factor